MLVRLYLNNDDRELKETTQILTQFAHPVVGRRRLDNEDVDRHRPNRLKKCGAVVDLARIYPCNLEYGLHQGMYHLLSQDEQVAGLGVIV